MDTIALPEGQVIVVTMDQRESRERGDLVETARHELTDRYRQSLALAFERTAGDEMQGVAREASWLVDFLLDATRQGDWWIGVALGGYDPPLGDSSRASRGQAFYAAREAVDRAKSTPWGFALDGGPRFEQVERCLIAASWIVRRRTDAQHRAVRLMREEGKGVRVAKILGITPTSVSQHLRTGGAPEENAARRLALELLAEAAA